jgi:hypothetical protein
MEENSFSETNNFQESSVKISKGKKVIYAILILLILGAGYSLEEGKGIFIYNQTIFECGRSCREKVYHPSLRNI